MQWVLWGVVIGSILTFTLGMIINGTLMDKLMLSLTAVTVVILVYEVISTMQGTRSGMEISAQQAKVALYEQMLEGHIPRDLQPNQDAAFLMIMQQIELVMMQSNGDISDTEWIRSWVNTTGFQSRWPIYRHLFNIQTQQYVIRAYHE